ncbi:hypothetical protein A3F34_01945 [Candidatus Roizmanbacteria bacterium RIFCSPHIGHO2_12_FULL_44_10]|uniref:SurA N-terminal domain-containing protein n=1 Tax=Candidatus Roizmanbacteria bacterium RIFCSPHIGHO2_12_FULL_44_10 TaxID=1802054 RepID=A0A1F7I6B8_9BACT|nr:MAG: hypothetical protein A3F34_01945 [Candidatus Roizmanbacteria bacterium RIFCSPHIGHO2_12_FULL_44_10]
MAVRKTTSRTSRLKKAITVTDSTFKNDAASNMTMRPAYAKWAVLLGIIVALGYAFKSLFVVALVNNQPITRIKVIQELERQGGEQTLSAIVSQTLIEQEAKKKGIRVTKEEIAAEVKKVEAQLKSQGQSLDQVLSAQGLTRKDVEDQTEIRIMLEKLLVNKVKVTEKEVDAAYEVQKEGFGPTVTEKQGKEQVRQNLQDQKLSTEVQTYLQALQKKAKILYFKEY